MRLKLNGILLNIFFYYCELLMAKVLKFYFGNKVVDGKEGGYF